jgi:hypothetical protein
MDMTAFEKTDGVILPAPAAGLPPLLRRQQGAHHAKL